MDEHDNINDLEKWEYINILFNDCDNPDIDKVECLSKDVDEDIRIEIAEVLNTYQMDETDKILYNLLSDSSELVRANACDSLYNSINPKTLDYLLNMLEDESEIVRGYAVLSIADIVISNGYENKEIAERLLSKIKKESKWVALSYYRALYMFGEKSYLREIGNSVFCENYRVQVFAVRTLGELLNTENSNYIADILEQKQMCENPESFEDAKEEVLNKIYNLNI